MPTLLVALAAVARGAPHVDVRSEGSQPETAESIASDGDRHLAVLDPPMIPGVGEPATVASPMPAAESLDLLTVPAADQPSVSPAPAGEAPSVPPKSEPNLIQAVPAKPTIKVPGKWQDSPNATTPRPTSAPSVPPPAVAAPPAPPPAVAAPPAPPPAVAAPPAPPTVVEPPAQPAVVTPPESPAAAKGLPSGFVANVLKLQPQSLQIVRDWKRGNGAVWKERWTNLHPGANAWFLWEVLDEKGAVQELVHLENPYPQLQALDFRADSGPGVVVLRMQNTETPCSLMDDAAKSGIAEARKDMQPYSPHCKERLFARHPTAGRATSKEFVANFLRKFVWGGEQITTLVKTTIYQDQFLASSEIEKEGGGSRAATLRRDVPMNARLSHEYQGSLLKVEDIALQLRGVTDGRMPVGGWVPAAMYDGVFISAIEPRFISDDLMKSYPNRVAALDQIERKALVYMVAFDLSRMNLEFAMGTEHPSVEWSERILPNMHDKSVGGPDGFSSLKPLVVTGRVNPVAARSVVATFTGGFKRSHGAFKWGELSLKNRGSHYGFMEQGVILSRLQPDLASIVIDIGGGVRMKTWEPNDDDSILPQVRHARQNGVPIIEGVDTNTQMPVPGKLVSRWGAGNWSGSIDSKQRALRAGICLQQSGRRSYLLYGYFTSVTPNAMARVFQAYGCTYAMHLDMNALEHTYLALVSRKEQGFVVENFIKGMEVLDSKHKDVSLPRFIGTSDNRDYFYLTTK